MLQNDAGNADADAQEGPANETPKEGNTFRENLSMINVIQQNAVIVTGREMKGDHRRPDKSNSERWL